MTEQDLAKLGDLHQLVCRTCISLSDRLGRQIDYLEIGVQEGIGICDVLSIGCVRIAVGIDTWGGNYGGTGRGNPDHVVSRLEKKAVNAILLTGNSPDVLRGMRHPFDVILVDGDHSEAGCIADLNAAAPLMTPYGVMLVDDLNHIAHPYLNGATQRWAAQNRMKFQFHDAAWGVGELTR